MYAMGWGLVLLVFLPDKFIQKYTWLAFVKRDRFFLAIVFLTLFLMRLPSIVYNGEINIDESQIISQALTLWYDPVYFRSVDGTTGGPLTSYLLVLPRLLGLPFDYITAHSVAFVLLAVSFGLTFYAARFLFGSRAARLALIPFLFLLGLPKTYDFLFYSSELLSVTTLSWLYYLVITQYKQPDKTTGQLLLIGFLCSLVPFEKIQGLLLAGAVGLFVVYQILTNKTRSAGQKGRQLLVLMGGAVAFPLAFIAWMYAEGLFDDFVNFYIRDNLSYSQPLTFFQKVIRFRLFLLNASEFAWLLTLLAGFCLLWLLTASRRFKIDIDSRLPFLFLLLVLLTAFYTVTFPGNYFIHYLYYVFGPLMLLFAFLLNSFRTSFSQVSAAILIIAFVSTFGIRLLIDHRRHQSLNPFASDQQGGWVLPQNTITRAISKYGHKGETLAVWGWHNDYYVRLQMPQAVAENHTIRSIEHKTLKPVYHKRYAANMLRSLPPVFVDVVGKQGFYLSDRKTQGYEINKALEQVIATHYTYAGLVDDVRLFVRNDRYQAVH
ncbi:hypothetical protein GCM10028773_03300 [Spirosoma koreense]